MKATVETIREIVKVLTADEQQLLKDTFLYGGWGDGSGDMLFVRSAWNKAWMEWAKEPIQPEEPKNEERLADAINACLAK